MITIRNAVDGFLLANRAKSPATRNTYATGLNAFREYLKAVGVDPDTSQVSALPERCLEQFYLWLVDLRGPDRQATIETYLSGLRGFLRYLTGEDAIPHISLERSREQLRRVKIRKNYLSPNVDSALSLVVQAANDTPLPEGHQSRFQAIRILRDRAILNTLYTTGMRRSEVAALNRVDLKAGRRGEALITGKGNKQRVVFFDESTLVRIAEYLAERSDGYAPLFISHPNRGKPGPRGENLRLSPKTIWLTVKRYARAAGISASTHDFRHLKATTMLGRGANLSEVQDLLGHASPETTKTIYAHYSIQQLRSAFDRYSQPLSVAVAGRNKGSDDSH